MTETGYPYGERPGDAYPPLGHPYLHLVDSAPGKVELKVSTPVRVIFCIELDYDEMSQFFEVLVRALLHRIRQLS